MEPESVEKSAGELAAEEELRQAVEDMRFEMAQAAIDVAGIVDPTPISDGISASMSIYKGDLIGAGLSLISMVPYVGDALGKSLKGSRTAAKIAVLEKKISVLTVRLNKLKEYSKVKAAQSKLGRKTLDLADKAKIKLGKVATKAVGPCPKVVNALAKARVVGKLGKPYPAMKLLPDWKKNLKKLPKDQQRKLLKKRQEAIKYWQKESLNKAVIDEEKKLGRKLTNEELSDLTSKVNSDVKEKIDSFDWSRYEEIEYKKKISTGEVFSRTGETPGNFSTRTDVSTQSQGEVFEELALPDTNQAEKLSKFKVKDDFEAIEGPVAGGSWSYYDDLGNQIINGPPRSGGGSQLVIIDGSRPFDPKPVQTLLIQK